MTPREIYEIVKNNDFKTFERLGVEELTKKTQDVIDSGIPALLPSEKIKSLTQRLLIEYTKLEKKDKKEAQHNGFFANLRYFLDELPIINLAEILHQQKDEDCYNLVYEKLSQKIKQVGYSRKAQTAIIYWISQFEKDLIDILKTLSPSLLLKVALNIEDRETRDDLLNMILDDSQKIFHFNVRKATAEKDVLGILQAIREFSTRKSTLQNKISISMQENWVDGLNPKKQKKLLAKIEQFLGNQLLNDPIAECFEISKNQAQYLEYAFGKTIGNFYGKDNLIQEVSAEFTHSSLFHRSSRRNRFSTVYINDFLSSACIYQTQYFMAGFYSAVPFHKLKRRISSYLLEYYPLLACNLIAAGAPMAMQRVQFMYEKMKERKDVKEHAEEYIRVAAEERVRRGFKSIVLPTRILIEATLTKKPLKTRKHS